MRKIILFALVTSISGCSFLEKTSVYENYSSWEWRSRYDISMGFIRRSFNEYENDQIKLCVYPRRLQSTRMLYGPAYFIPFIPNLFHSWPESSTARYKENFYVRILVQNKAGKLITDLSKITFDFDGRIHQPVLRKATVHAVTDSCNCFSPEKYLFAAWTDTSGMRSKPNPSSQIEKQWESILTSKSEILDIQYEFDYETIRIDDIEISFNDFVLVQPATQIPKLVLTNKNYYEYIPFEFGH